ncbi:MAG TPA: ATP-binding protein, partial [Opitutaceae bacterium]|nr:ATP-binding protein [Opitutaceae bacterium]
IKQIVAMQQSFAKVGGASENLQAHELMEDALRICSSGLTRHQVEVSREFQIVPTVLVDRHKVLQILVNLITNAKQALESRESQRKITLRIHTENSHHVRMEVVDNGMGIPADSLTRIFQHGFTTKKTGHGFGLHSGANAAKELGGSLRAYSDGQGQGARFVLEVPVTPTRPSSVPAPALDPSLFYPADSVLSTELATSTPSLLPIR